MALAKYGLLNNINSSAWDETERGLWQRPAQLGKLGSRLHTLTFPRRRNHSQGLSWHWAVPPCGEVIRVESNCSSYPLQCIKTFFLISPLPQSDGVLELLCWTSKHPQRFSYPIHGATAEWTAGAVICRSVCLLNNAGVGNTPSGSPGIWC